MTGWGQDGPLAQAAGHDINYISVAGALFGMGQTPERPQFPANLVGDFGGGSTYLVIGLLAALLEAQGLRPGPGRGRRDRGRHRAPQRDDVGVPGQRRLPGGARRQPARRRRARSTTSTRPPTASTCRSARSSRSSSPRCVSMLGARGHRARPGRPGPVRRAAHAAHRHVQAADPGRVGRAVRGHRRLRRRLIPISEAPDHPHLKARQTFVEHEGHRAAAAGAAVLAHRARRSRCRRRRPPARTPARRSTAWGVADVDGLIERGVAVQV